MTKPSAIHTAARSNKTEAAMQAHQKAREQYLEARAKNQQIFDNLMRHRASATAASNSAATAAAKWREELRTTGGIITKSVKELRRTATEDKELAEELTAIAAETEKALRTQQAKTSALRLSYVDARERAESVYLETRIDELFTRLLDSDDGKALVGLITASKRVIIEGITNNALFNETYGPQMITSRSQKELKDRYDKELNKLISAPFVERMNKAESYQDTQLDELRLIPFNMSIETRPESKAQRMIRSQREAKDASRTIAAVG